MPKESEIVTKPDPLDSKSSPGGFFNLTNVAKEKIAKKRKKKGLPEQKPKKVATSSQLFLGWTSAVAAKCLLTPIERLRIIMQVDHVSNRYDGRSAGSLKYLGRKLGRLIFRNYQRTRAHSNLQGKYVHGLPHFS